MNRKNFLRNSLLAIAASLVPKILQPVLPEVMEEALLEHTVYVFDANQAPDVWIARKSDIEYTYTYNTGIISRETYKHT